MTRAVNPAAEDVVGLRTVLGTLCLTQVVGWRVVHYSFPVLSGVIAADTGWSMPALAAAFSAGLVVSAPLGVPVGRWLDRQGPRRLMTAGSVVAALAMLGVAWSPDLRWFAAAWLLLERP